MDINYEMRYKPGKRFKGEFKVYDTYLIPRKKSLLSTVSSKFQFTIKRRRHQRPFYGLIGYHSLASDLPMERKVYSFYRNISRGKQRRGSKPIKNYKCYRYKKTYRKPTEYRYVNARYKILKIRYKDTFGISKFNFIPLLKLLIISLYGTTLYKKLLKIAPKGKNFHLFKERIKKNLDVLRRWFFMKYKEVIPLLKGLFLLKKKIHRYFLKVMKNIKKQILKNNKEKKPNIWDLSFTDLIRFIFPNKILKEEHLKNILKMYKKSVAPSPLGANLFPKRNIKVELEYRRKRRYGYWRNKKKGKRKTSLFPLWIYNIFAYSYPKTFPNEHSNVRDIFKNLHILKFFLRYLKFYRNMNSKKRLFFFNTLIVSLLSLLILLPNSSLKRRLLLFLLLCYYYLYTFKFLYFQYNQQIFQKKFLLFYKLSSLIFFSLRKVQFVTQEKDNISLRFYGLNNKNVNANFLVNYIMVKLGEYFSINEITWPIINRLKRFAFVRGFRLVVSGRLTRRQRATYMIRSFRRMPSLHIDIR